MRYGLAALGLTSILAGAAMAQGVRIPPDIRQTHWARPAVKVAMENGILAPERDGQFHGEAKVTRAEAAIALAKLAQKLEKGQWKPGAGAVVSNRVMESNRSDWRQQPVTRYVLASTLTRFGNYIQKGLVRPKPNEKQLGKSVVLPKATVALASSHPAYASVKYLASRRMIRPDSPLLKPDKTPIKGAELSRALAQMATGLNDRLTDIFKDDQGGSIDVNSRPRR